MNNKSMKKNKILYFLPVLLLAGVVLYGGLARAENDDHKKNDDKDKKFSFVSNITGAFKSDKQEARLNGSNLEVHFSDNGNVLVRGAKVTSVSGSTVNATTSWGALSLNWTVNTTSSTNMLRRNGGKMALADIVVGDFVSFSGTATASSSNSVTVNATALKNWSLTNVKTRSSIEGSVKSVASASVPTTMVVTTENNKDYTVSLSANTSLVNNAWLATPLASFAVAQKVNVYGAVNDSTLTVNPTTVLRLR